MARAAVVVLAWNGAEYLGPCLEALRGQQADDFEIVVVDNGSTDGTLAALAPFRDEITLIENGANLGFAGGNNVAIAMLLARPEPPEWIVLLNQDTVVEPGWLAELLAAGAARPDAGVIGCEIVGPDGALQHSGGAIEWPLATGRHEQAPRTELSAADYVTGAALAVRSDVMRELGGFDAGFAPAYYEDVDLCWRARAAGHAVLVAPEARLMHHEGAQQQTAQQRWMYHRNRLRLILKHGDVGLWGGPFGAAERAEIARWRIQDSAARKRAYLTALLSVRELLGARGAAKHVPIVAAELERLYRSVLDTERQWRAETLASKQNES